MKRLGITLVASLALCPTTQARAQTGVLTETETRVRVRAVNVRAPTESDETRDARFVGYLDRVFADSVWIRLDAPDGPRLSIDRANIRELEISSGRKRNAGKGALFGSGIGLGVGILAAASAGDCTMGTSRYWFDPCDGQEGVLILGSVAAGAALGALIGSLITTERWVAVPPASLTLRSERRGIRLAVEVRLRL